MRSPGSEFKFIDRGFKETLLPIPGWATDYRVFAPLDLDFNYLLPVVCRPAGFAGDCVRAMDGAGLAAVSILGWSMGGFMASDLFKGHPERVRELILTGMRDKYEPDGLSRVRSYLENSRAGYLRKFYAACFSECEREPSAWFKANLLKAYLREMELEPLLAGLDYLAAARLDPDSLRGARVRFIHGSADAIAPPETILRIREALPRAEYYSIAGAGHMPFLGKGFKEMIHGR